MRLPRRSLLLWALPIALAAQGGGSRRAAIATREPENLVESLKRLVRYHDSGAYDADIRRVAAAAHQYLEQRVKQEPAGAKLAAVFDIDETSLSTWKRMTACGFCPIGLQYQLFPDIDLPPIEPVLDLYRFAQSKNVAPIFLTGRPESLRAWTVRTLMAAGYADWAELVMFQPGDKGPASAWKALKRDELMQKGYKIVLSIGDQASDLAGCCAERTFKLPNPFYFVE